GRRGPERRTDGRCACDHASSPAAARGSAARREGGRPSSRIDASEMPGPGTARLGCPVSRPARTEGAPCRSCAPPHGPPASPRRSRRSRSASVEPLPGPPRSVARTRHPSNRCLVLATDRVVAAAALLLWGLLQIASLVIPVLIAVLLAALLTPVVKVLTRYTFLGRGAASGIALLGLLLVISGMFTLAGRQLFAQSADIQDKAIAGFQSLTDWATGTFKIDDTMVNSAIDEGLDKLQENSDQLVSGALGTA